LEYRTYNPERDKDAVHRIWKETGWIEDDDYESMDLILEHHSVIVADVNDRAECLVESVQADIDYLSRRLLLSVISSVTTSLVARKSKLALRLTAQRLALDAADSAAVSALGVFDQGFYNKLGFGNGCYVIRHRFSPSLLRIDVTPRVPLRLGKEDWERIHRARLKRMRGHGSVSIFSPFFTRAELMEKTSFGLGYQDDGGELTHLLWMEGLGKDYGPFRINMMVYRTWDQFRELLALVRTFGDQINLVRIFEPPGVQLQDFLERPFFIRRITEKSQSENNCWAESFFQWRILDLQKCLTEIHLPGKPVRFNLRLTDPVVKYLDSGTPWRGVGGEYTVTLGEECSVGAGEEKSLPTLECSVNAFTRLWLGILTAEGLSVSDDFRAPEGLIRRLDNLLRLPAPQPNWMF